MFAADAELEVLARGAAAFDGDGNQLAHAIHVETDEGVALENPLVAVGGDEIA